MSLKNYAFILGVFLLGGLVGWLVNSATLGKYNVVNGTCSVINAAVDNKLIPQDQVRFLGQMSQHYLLNSTAGDAFQLDEEQIEAASPNSHCSQFMVGMSSH